MEQVVNDCITYIKERRGLSLNTLISYERDIRQYSDYLKNRGISDTRQAEKDVLLSYIKMLNDSGKSPSTVSRCISSLRMFYRYLIRNGLVYGNPIVGISTPKIVKKKTNNLSKQDVLKFLEAPGKEGVKCLRDKVIIEFLCETGLKVNELISLNVDNLDFDKSRLSYGEGRKKHHFLIKACCIENLYAYLTHSRPYLLKDSQEPSLFLNNTGRRISRQGIWKIIKKYSKLVHIEGDVTPCKLKHALSSGITPKDARKKQQNHCHPDPS